MKLPSHELKRVLIVKSFNPEELVPTWSTVRPSSPGLRWSAVIAEMGSPNWAGSRVLLIGNSCKVMGSKWVTTHLVEDFTAGSYWIPCEKSRQWVHGTTAIVVPCTAVYRGLNMSRLCLSCRKDESPTWFTWIGWGCCAARLHFPQH